MDNPLLSIKHSQVVVIGNVNNRFFFEKYQKEIEIQNEYSFIEVKCDDDYQLPHIYKNQLYGYDNKLIQCDYIILLMPIIKNESAVFFWWLNSLSSLSSKIIYVSCPECSPTDKLYPLLAKLYYQAIDIDYKKLVDYNRFVIAQIKKGTLFRLVSDKGTNLNIYIYNNIINHEDCILEKEKLIQLPGGEVFFPVDFRRCFGTFFFENQYYIVKEGRFVFEGISRIIGEFGIGTNPGLTFIRGIPIIEKAKQTFHLGLGYNIDFGGDIDEAYHFDLVLSDCLLYIDDKLFTWEL